MVTVAVSGTVVTVDAYVRLSTVNAFVRNVSYNLTAYMVTRSLHVALIGGVIETRHPNVLNATLYFRSKALRSGTMRVTAAEGSVTIGLTTNRANARKASRYYTASEHSALVNVTVAFSVAEGTVVVTYTTRLVHMLTRPDRVRITTSVTVVRSTFRRPPDRSVTTV